MNRLTFALGGFVALAVLAFSVILFTHQDVHANPYTATVLGTATTSTAYSVTSTANTRVLSTTTPANGVGAAYTRVYASICNPSSTVVYLNMDRDKPVTSSSSVAQIAAAAGYQNCYEITDRNMYQGSVQASSTVGTVSVFVTEYVQ